ncbi:hypothetical protein [Methylophilus sp. 5]|uniref:hypothetical protein n=1 Tax=Methylophilus sp. 5 TaxID=1112274 RepID=UPI001E3E9905|nr:hypothetical protein [Methylophilus sp. 5]
MRLLLTTLFMAWTTQVTVALAEGVVDPTKPPASVMEYLPNAQTQTEQPWELTAIQDNGKAGFAVVNGQMVQVGGSYEGFKLISVKNQKAVFVSKLGEKKVVGMGLASVIKPVQLQTSMNKTNQPRRLKNQAKKLKNKD